MAGAHLSRAPPRPSAARLCQQSKAGSQEPLARLEPKQSPLPGTKQNVLKGQGGRGCRIPLLGHTGTEPAPGAPLHPSACCAPAATAPAGFGRGRGSVSPLLPAVWSQQAQNYTGIHTHGIPVAPAGCRPQPAGGEMKAQPHTTARGWRASAVTPVLPKTGTRAPPPPPPGTGTVPWDLGRAWELHLLAGIRGQGRGHALPGCLRGAGGRPRRLAAFPNDPESSAAKALSRDTSSQGTCSWPGAGMLP